MPIRPPPIAGPPYEDIAGRAERLAKLLSKWRPPANGQMDSGRALIRVFDRMARHVIERINRIPDRSFLAFLNLVGVEPTPPRPAHVPLTFTLVERSGAEPTIPAGTRVGAVQADSGMREVVFETTRELATTQARLAAVLVRQPDGDRWADRTAAATGKLPDTYPAFGGVQTVEHAFLLSVDDLHGLPTGTEVTVLLTFASPAELQTWQGLNAPGHRPALAMEEYYKTHAPEPPLVRWSYWNGASWTDLPLTSAGLDATSQWQLTFPLLDDMKALSVGARTARWIRATLAAWPRASIPPIQSIKVSARISRSEIAPDFARATGRPADLSMDFHPLGEHPRLSDTFLVASEEVLSRPGATVTVTVKESAWQATALHPDDKPKLAWEVPTASGWEKLLDTEPTQPSEPEGSPPKNDALRTMSFSLPANLTAAEVQGLRAHWLRIRLVSGAFGKGLLVLDGAVVDTDRPPILAKLTLGYEQALQLTAPTCLTYDGFTFTERTNQGAFLPFIRSPESKPALYLGFDRPFAPRHTLLYVQAAPPSIEEARQATTSGSAPLNIAWEYSAPEGWAPLGAEDETRGFERSGLLRFVGPERFASRLEFGRKSYWLRARLEADTSAVMPRLGHILTNTVWGAHSATITEELLGSSNGGADQVFTLSQRPVLEGQHIEVREPELPPEAERTELERHEGPDAIRRVGAPERPREIWVRWREVPDFHASGPRDRHYRIDRQTGEVRFGDGQRGMIPPRGVRSVRAAMYRTGGGAGGNQPAGAVGQLKTSIPYVEGVTNREPAMGGTDRESVENVQQRGPRQLRHGGRAVTVEDFEDLAHEASSMVARVKVLTPVFDPIDLVDSPRLPSSMHVVVLIVPFGPDLPPRPGPGLIQDVAVYLRRRCAPAVSLRVVGPDWVQVGTTVTLVPASLEGLDALRARVQHELADFLHPLTGGFDGNGWRFGQLPRESDLYRRLGAIPGVESVRTITLNLTLPEPERAALALVHSGTHSISFVPPEGRT